MRTVPALATQESRSWAAAVPSASVVVATHGRSAWLRELLLELDAQAGDAEVLVADDGSDDDTWEVLTAWAASTPVPALVLRLPASGGPSVPRNTAAARARADVLVFTDDDCLPSPEWVERMTAGGRTAVVQGRTVPDGDRRGPWDRTIRVDALTGLWETCNLALPRAAFLECGGFPVRDLLGAGGRGFGEDVLLGAAAARRLPTAFDAAAVVRHRWVPTDYRGHLRSRWRLRGFPLLVGEVPELRDALWHGRFLATRSAVVDLGLAGLLLRRPAGAVPWLALAARDARALPGPTGKRLAQVLVADAVGAAGLAVGSARGRRLLL